MKKTVFYSLVCFTVLLVVLIEVEDVRAHKLVHREVSGTKVEDIQTVDSGQPHTRRKRTIGHIFNMFRGFMSNMFGKGGQRGRGRRPQRPSSGYGAPQSSYRAPQTGYNPPSQSLGQSGSPPALSGGNIDSYGSPQAPSLDSYGSPQAPALGGGNLDSYGSPQAPVIGGGNLDSYGSPQAPILGGGGSNLDSYGSPQAPPLGGGDPDSYGSPQAPPIGGGNLGTYGSPQGGNSFSQVPNQGSYQSAEQSNSDNYGSPQGPPQQNYGNQGFNPGLRLPPGGDLPNYGGVGPPRGLPSPGSIAPPELADSVFKMLPAPNLATEGPNLFGQSFGSQQQQNQNSYGSPQLDLIRSQDSYGSPQSGVNNNFDGQGPAVIEARPAQGSYGAPQFVDNQADPVQESYGAPENPFLPSNQPSLSTYVDNGINPRVAPTVLSVTPGEQSIGVTQESSANERLPDSYGNLENQDQPEGEVTRIQVEGEEQSPAFDNLRDNVGEKQLDATESPEANKDLRASGIELTGEDDNYDDGATTTVEPIFPEYKEEEEDGDDDDDGEDYDQYDVKGLPGYLENNPSEKTPDLPSANNLESNDKNPEKVETVKPVEGVLLNEKEIETKAEPANNSVESEDDEQQPGYGENGEETPTKKEKVAEVQKTDNEDSKEIEDEIEDEKKDENSDTDSNQLSQSSSLEDEYGDNNDLENVGVANDVKISGDPNVDSTTEAAFISVPLLIEEISDNENGGTGRPGDPTVILAGSPDEVKVPDTVYGAPGNPRKGRENERTLHQFLVDVPNAKRQADWSQRLRERQRQQIWRQFQLD